MKKHPYHDIINLKTEGKEYIRFCKGKSKKFKLFSEWEEHIKILLSGFKSSADLYNFKRYCIIAARSQEKAPDMFLWYVSLIIPLYLNLFFDKTRVLLILIVAGIIAFYAIVQNKRLAKESGFIKDIITIIEETGDKLEFGQYIAEGHKSEEDMKKEKRKRFISNPILWIIVVQLLIVLALLIFGFRITYAPELENSWDAISACAAWAGVIISLGAVMVAVRIPKLIAARQDRIALFEKRYMVYSMLAKCITYGHMLDIFLESLNERYWLMLVAFEKQKEFKIEANFLVVAPTYFECERMLEQSKFLFSEAISSNILEILTLLTLLMNDKINDKKAEETLIQAKNDYIELVKKAEVELLPLIEEAMQLY